MKDKNTAIASVYRAEDGYLIQMNGTPDEATSGIGQLIGELIIQIANRHDRSEKEVFAEIMAAMTTSVVNAINKNKKEMN